MRATVSLGRFAGVPVGAHWSVLLTVALLVQVLAMRLLPATVPHQQPLAYWSVAAASAVVFFAALLAHELSHAVLARHYGIRVKRVTVWLLGGMTELDGQPPTARADAVIAAVGPFTSLVIGGFCGGGAYLAERIGAGGLVVTALVWLAMINLFIGAFNLLPGAPLDGGRILRAVLWQRYGDRERARRAAAGVGQFLGWLMVGFGGLRVLTARDFGGLWFVLLGWFMVIAAGAERSVGRLPEHLAGMRVRDVMSPDPVVVAGWWTVRTLIDWFIEHAPRHRIFPVVDFDGRPVGVIGLAALARVPEDLRMTTRVQDAGRPIAQVSTVAPDVALADLLSVPVFRPGREVTLVLEGGRLVGLLTAGDFARAMELSALRRCGRRGATAADNADTDARTSL